MYTYINFEKHDFYDVTGRRKIEVRPINPLIISFDHNKEVNRLKFEIKKTMEVNRKL